MYKGSLAQKDTLTSLVGCSKDNNKQLNAYRWYSLTIRGNAGSIPAIKLAGNGNKDKKEDKL